LSQKDFFPGKGSGEGPADVDHEDRYCSKNVLVGHGYKDRILSWSSPLKPKAGIASNDTLLAPSLPCVIGIEACNH